MPGDEWHAFAPTQPAERNTITPQAACVAVERWRYLARVPPQALACRLMCASVGSFFAYELCFSLSSGDDLKKHS